MKKYFNWPFTFNKWSVKRFVLFFWFYPIRHSWFYLFILNLPFVFLGGSLYSSLGLMSMLRFFYKTYPKACQELIPCFMFWVDFFFGFCCCTNGSVSGFGCIAWYLWGVFHPKHGSTTSKCWKELHLASDYVPWKWAILRQPACKQ